MGYNNRAVRLHRLAQQVVTHYAGKIPSSREALLSLPGIGEYTADAIRSSAFREAVPAIDVNVRRVLSRIFTRMASFSSVRPEREIALLAQTVLPRTRAYDWNQALMDLGATLCTARAPRCPECPVSNWCRSGNRMARSSRRPRRSEPSRAGIPNRIYRGRIVEILRQKAHQDGVTAGALGRTVYPGFSRRDADWLDRLLDALKSDGLIEIRGGRRQAERRIVLK
jgi:A/G-specific adenine glycosylase